MRRMTWFLICIISLFVTGEVQARMAMSGKCEWYTSGGKKGNGDPDGTMVKVTGVCHQKRCPLPLDPLVKYECSPLIKEGTECSTVAGC